MYFLVNFLRTVHKNHSHTLARVRRRNRIRVLAFKIFKKLVKKYIFLKKNYSHVPPGTCFRVPPGQYQLRYRVSPIIIVHSVYNGDRYGTTDIIRLSGLCTAVVALVLAWPLRIARHRVVEHLYRRTSRVVRVVLQLQ